jgi:hypothetical protein
MRASIDVDSRQLTQFLSRVQAGLGVAMSEVIKGEAGSILKECVLRTKVAKTTQVNARAGAEANRSTRARMFGGSGKKLKRGEMWRNAGRLKGGSTAGRVWFRIPRGPGTKFLLLKGVDGANIWGSGRPKTLRRRGGIGISATRSDYPSKKLMARAEYFEAQVKQEEKAKRVRGDNARGLARQSWVQISDDAGIVLESVRGGRSATAAIAKARRAIASNGRRYDNGGADWRNVASSFRASLTLRNFYPLAPQLRFQQTLNSVIAGRVGYARRVLGEGVLPMAARIARAYPNIRVTTSF